MDPQHLAKRTRPAGARQRIKATPSSARMRHTQQPSGGGVFASKRVSAGSARNAPLESDAPPSSAAAILRDRLQSGANVTMSVLGDRVRRASEQISQMSKDPRARPSTWIVEPSWYERFHSWLADAMPFSWRERSRRRGFWRRRVVPVVAVVAILAMGFAVGLFALNTAGHAAEALSGSAPAAQATAGSSVMISPLNVADTTPTPVAQQYNVGVWVSDTLPQGGSVTVFVRVSNNALAQPNAHVFIHADTPNGVIIIGPFTTDAYGVASAPLRYGNVGSQQPIFVTATTTINGQTVSGEYTFVTY